MAEWYDDYLRSQHWQRTRIRRLLRAEINEEFNLIRCERKDCGLLVPLGAIDIHHLTYARVGKEQLDDLACFCRSCHGVEHGFEPRLWWKEAKRGRGECVFMQQINRDRHLHSAGDLMLECLAHMEKRMPLMAGTENWNA